MRLRLLSIVLLCSLFLLPASAQIPGNKFFANSSGDLWTWFVGGNPQQITDWHFNGGPILAPDERFIAYLSLSTEAVQEIQAGTAAFMGTSPNNIWVMDTATQLAERIAAQDSYPTLRGTPAWSPSGRELAWIEFVQGAQTHNTRLVVYDLDTRRSTILNDNVNLGFQDGGYYIHSVQWGVHGISRIFSTFAENGKIQFILELYNPEDGSLSQFLLAEASMSENSPLVTPPLDYVWVLHQGQDMIALLMGDGSWQLLDPLTGNRFELNRAPALVNNHSSASITPIWRGADSWEIYWQVNDGTIQHELPFSNYSISQNTPALAPDGSAVAWNDNGNLGFLNLGTGETATLLQDPQTASLLMQPNNIVWSAMYWMTKADTGAAISGPSVSAGDACGLTSRLSIGDRVTVSAGQPNNVRQEARLDATVVAQFASGVVADVVDGPVCIDGFRWWYVSNADFAGWTAEGNATQYWLEPIGG